MLSLFRVSAIKWNFQSAHKPEIHHLLAPARATDNGGVRFFPGKHDASRMRPGEFGFHGKDGVGDGVPPATREQGLCAAYPRERPGYLAGQNATQTHAGTTARASGPVSFPVDSSIPKTKTLFAS